MADNTTSIRISKLTHLWTKRLQSLLSYYDGEDFTIDDVIAMAVIEYDHRMARRHSLTTQNLEKYMRTVSRKMMKQEEKRLRKPECPKCEVQLRPTGECPSCGLIPPED